MPGLAPRGWETVRAQCAALVVAMVLLLGCGLVAVDQVTDSIEDMIAHTTEARLRGAAAQAVLAALQESETGQRGYLLTGRPSYLAPYTATINRIEELLRALDARVGDDPMLQDAFQRLAANARTKVSEMRQTVAIAQRDGPGVAGTVVLSDMGERAMQEVRAAATEIINQAERERAISARALQKTQQRVTDILLAALVAAVLLLGVAALVLVWRKDKLRRARDGERLQALRLQAAIDHAPDGMAVFDAGNVLRLCNTRFASTLAVPPHMAQPGVKLGLMAENAAFDPPLDPARPAASSTTEVRQGPRTLEVWRSPMPDGGQMLTVADVTRRVQAEEVGRQAQKMDVLGQMTGGVAHDFNNLLQIISANLELVRGKVSRTWPSDAALLDRIDAAAAGVVRGARLTRHLLAFARRQPLAPEALDPARLLLGMEDMLRRTLGEAVRLDLVVGTKLWSMRADPTQFENALLNLALNARDAMAGPDGVSNGMLTVEAANAALEEAEIGGARDVRPGHYVMFAVTDTGSGMTPDQIARAAEPFYTTKSEGRGTGLGLSMVLGFAKQSGGHFQLFSEPGRGTTARLYIPRTTAPVQAAEKAPPDLRTGRGELVLLVEDDAMVRQVAREAVLGLGYQVVEAEDADSALLLLDRGIQPRVLFTDVVMPGTVNATDLARRARARVPGLVVLFTSGYTQNSIVVNGQLDEGVTLLSKPWRTEQLARALHSVLSGTAARPVPLRRVLLVEDEELIRATTADALTDLGFEVVQAGTADAALSRLDPAPDLLLTDLGLPDRNGAVLVQEVRQRLPGLPVIVASGHSESPDADVVWLAKPFDLQGLRRAVEQAVGAGLHAAAASD